MVDIDGSGHLIVLVGEVRWVIVNKGHGKDTSLGSQAPIIFCLASRDTEIFSWHWRVCSSSSRAHVAADWAHVSVFTAGVYERKQKIERCKRCSNAR